MATAAVKARTTDGAAWVAEWNLAQGETGDSESFVWAADKTIQVFGTFGGATVVLEGSCQNTPTNWEGLTDPQGVAISGTAAMLASITEIVAHARPRVVGGDVTTAVTCVLLMRGTNK